MKKLTVVIPSWKDRYLPHTVNDLLEHSELGDAMEIVVVLDGYDRSDLPETNERVRVIRLKQNVGMREAINTAIRESESEYIMRTDEHCMFAHGYDRVLIDTCEPNWIVTPRRYALDPTTWSIMPEHPPIDTMKLTVIKRDTFGENSLGKFTGVDWRSRNAENADVMIDESMAMQGSCWLMPRAWWDRVIGTLQTEGYGPHYQDSHEMVFKTWQMGGKLMVNKHTWYAHKHRTFRRTHHLPIHTAAPGFDYCLQTWGKYYNEVICPKWFGRMGDAPV